MKSFRGPLRLGLWLLALGAAGLAHADAQFDLAWDAFDASGARLAGGIYQLDAATGQPDAGMLDGIIGQHDAGTIDTTPLTIWGGVMSPLNPTLQILNLNTPTRWLIGQPVQIQWWADRAVAGGLVRFELWRGTTKLADFGSARVASYSLYTTVIVPNVTWGPLCRLRMVSTQLEALGNPNPWVETAPILAIVNTTAVEPRAWAIYE